MLKNHREISFAFPFSAPLLISEDTRLGISFLNLFEKIPLHPHPQIHAQ